MHNIMVLFKAAMWGSPGVLWNTTLLNSHVSVAKVPEFAVTHISLDCCQVDGQSVHDVISHNNYVTVT